MGGGAAQSRPQPKDAGAAAAEKADASARMAGVCFLGLLAVMLMKIVLGG